MLPLFVDSAVTSARGCRRGRNQDCHALLSGGRALVVADGAPSRALRGLASRAAVAAIVSYFEQQRFNEDDILCMTPRQAESHLRAAFVRMQQSLRVESRGRGLRGSLGVSVGVVLILGSQLVVAQQGHTACYLVRDGAARLLDQKPYAGEAMQPGMASITPIARAMKFQWEPIEAGDSILLCSDGLSEMLTDAVLGEVVSQSSSAQSACASLLALAIEAGGKDDMTALVVMVSRDGERAVPR